MIIGIDFDNTIICHDDSFRKIAFNKDIHLKKNSNPKENFKKNLLKQSNGNLLWTKAQGEVYGENILSAKIFEGFKDFLDEAISRNHKILIISHRTIFPAIGKHTNLHQNAIRWLIKNSIISNQRIDKKDCFFETTLEKKISRIHSEKCDIFIDDLISVLEHKEFPSQIIRILFGKKHKSILNFRSWKNAKWLFSLSNVEVKASPPPSMTLPNNLHEESFRKILKIPCEEELYLKKISGGENNCSYKISTCGKIFMGKVFYRNQNDSRDRLFHEISFAHYLEYLKFKLSPKLIAFDQKLGIAVYEWIIGKPFHSNSDIKMSHWRQCLDFIIYLQTKRKSELAIKIPLASESAFSLSTHWGILQRRHDYWFHRVNNEPMCVPDSIKDFLINELEINYIKLAKDVLGHPNFNSPIVNEDRILSPSDFGLHNALLQKNNLIRFFDFEYAGWDDPAKTIADFFAQPRISAPIELFNEMKNRIMEVLPNKSIESFLQRLPLVIRIINAKWCYICLNAYHPEYKKRKMFAESTDINLTILNQTLAKLVKGVSTTFK